MVKEPNPHDVLGMFQRDAELMLQARADAIAIHQEGDIREAGDQIEIPVRDIFGKRFQHTGYVTRGHLVDEKWQVSPQLDFILSNPKLFPIWNTYNSKADQVFYDSVHAIGEIKSSYRLEGGTSIISKFCDTIGTVKNKMVRPSSDASDKFGMTVGPGMVITSPDPMDYYNPLFCFMLIISSDTFKLEHIDELYRGHRTRDLPNIVCMLDRGVIVSAATLGPALRRVNSIPEVDVFRLGPGEEANWLLLAPEDPATRAGACLMILHGLLLTHLRRTFLRAGDQDVFKLVPKFGGNIIGPSI